MNISTLLDPLLSLQEANLLEVKIEYNSDKVFYHGTSSTESAQSIIEKGLTPPNLENRKDFLTPVAGRVYLSQNIGYALIYALGGDMAGHTLSQKWIDESRYGYIFIVEGKEIQDIQPDEDEIGRLISDEEACPGWLRHMAQYNLGEATYRRVMDGEYIWWAKAGKKLVKLLRDDQMIDLISQGVHVAHNGALNPSKVIVVDKTLCPQFKKDGSNLTDLCEIKSI